MTFLNPLEWIRNRAPKGGRRRKPADVVEALTENYQDLLRLARQIRSHAAMAPYPAVKERLNRMAEEKEERAAVLKEKIGGLGATVAEEPSELYAGRNLWERMARDLAEQKDLEDRLFGDLLFLEVSPELGNVLGGIIEGEKAHREILTELLVKADPQATQS